MGFFGKSKAEKERENERAKEREEQRNTRDKVKLDELNKVLDRLDQIRPYWDGNKTSYDHQSIYFDRDNYSSFLWFHPETRNGVVIFEEAEIKISEIKSGKLIPIFHEIYIANEEKECYERIRQYVMRHVPSSESSIPSSSQIAEAKKRFWD